MGRIGAGTGLPKQYKANELSRSLWRNRDRAMKVGRQKTGGGLTKTGPTKSGGAAFRDGRLRIARAYLRAARNEVLLAEYEDIGIPRCLRSSTPQ
jgi:hypothetical protein